MLSVSHALTGAFLATKLSNPVLAVPLILLSHYAFDAVPHWDVGTGLSKGTKSPQSAIKHEVIDLALAGILVLVYFPTPYLGLLSFILSPAIYGATIGLLPDFLEAPRNFWKWEPRWLAPLNRFHHSFHHSIPRISDGLAPQFLLLVLLWIWR